MSIAQWTKEAQLRAASCRVAPLTPLVSRHSEEFVSCQARERWNFGHKNAYVTVHMWNSTAIYPPTLNQNILASQ